MTWFKIDDGFYDHPKVVAVLDSEHPAAAIACWTLAGTYCARHLTDGFISSKQLRRLCADVDHVSGAAALVDAELWLEVDGGYQFHQWTDHQPTRDEVEAKRKRDRDRVAKYRAKRRKSDADAVTDDGSDHVTRYTPPCNAVTDDPVTRDKTVTSHVSNSASNGTPARPGPTRPDPSSSPKPPAGGEEEAGQSEQGEPLPLKARIAARFDVEPVPTVLHRTLEMASHLVTDDQGRPVVEVAPHLSNTNSKRLEAIAAKAERLASDAGCDTAHEYIVHEWLAFARLAKAGELRPDAPVPMFVEMFGRLHDLAIEKGAADRPKPRLVPVEAAS